MVRNSLGKTSGMVRPSRRKEIANKIPAGSSHKDTVEVGEALLEGNGTTVLHKAVQALGSADYLFADAHGVGKLNLQRSDFRYAHLNGNLVLEGRGVLVMAFYSENRRYDAFRLHPFEAVAQLVHPVNAGFLHEPDIITMVRDAHSVAFVIADSMYVGFHFSLELRVECLVQFRVFSL